MMSDSLLASASTCPARSAASVGRRPTAPARPLRTTSVGAPASSVAAASPGEHLDARARPPAARRGPGAATASSATATTGTSWASACSTSRPRVAAARGQPGDGERVAVAGDDVEGLGADRARRAEHGHASHAAESGSAPGDADESQIACQDQTPRLACRGHGATGRPTVRRHPMTPRASRPLALLAALLVAGGLAGPAAAAPDDLPGVAHGRGASSPAEVRAVAAYWTPERMRAARSADVLAPVVTPEQASRRRRRAPAAAQVPRQAAKPAKPGKPGRRRHARRRRHRRGLDRRHRGRRHHRQGVLHPRRRPTTSAPAPR